MNEYKLSDASHDLEKLQQVFNCGVNIYGRRYETNSTYWSECDNLKSFEIYSPSRSSHAKSIRLNFTNSFGHSFTIHVYFAFISYAYEYTVAHGKKKEKRVEEVKVTQYPLMLFSVGDIFKFAHKTMPICSGSGSRHSGGDDKNKDRINILKSIARLDIDANIEQ